MAKSNFNSLRDWSDHTDDGIPGLEDLDDLFVPINVGNVHWLFAHVDFRESSIKLYDSSGQVSPGHRQYLVAIRRYLFDDEFKDTSVNLRPDFDEWKRSWKLENRSYHTPRQRNDFDCGVFTMLSIYLLSMGVTLSRSTYDQHIVTHQQLRRSIASALMKANDLAPEGSVLGYMSRQGNTAASRSRRRKRKRDESRVVAGKGKLQKQSDGPARPPASTVDKLINKKRTAKSVSSTPKRSLTIAQLLLQPPKPKRPKNAT